MTYYQQTELAMCCDRHNRVPGAEWSSDTDITTYHARGCGSLTSGGAHIVCCANCGKIPGLKTYEGPLLWVTIADVSTEFAAIKDSEVLA